MSLGRVPHYLFHRVLQADILAKAALWPRSLAAIILLLFWQCHWLLQLAWPCNHTTCIHSQHAAHWSSCSDVTCKVGTFCIWRLSWWPRHSCQSWRVYEAVAMCQIPLALLRPQPIFPWRMPMSPTGLLPQADHWNIIRWHFITTLIPCSAALNTENRCLPISGTHHTSSK